ncbi:hypothetical protein PGB90_000972 [Kerria lacca]
MLKFLNDLLKEENMWYFKEEVLDAEIQCEDEKLSQYIIKLQKIIKKQRIILRKFCTKVKEYQRNLDSSEVSTQTDADMEVNSEKNNLHFENETSLINTWKTEHSSVEEMVKEVAEHALKQTGFVYESTSGLYYDYSSGYYYNAELGLYYDGNSGTYFYYDKEKNVFQFHSQVNVTKNEISEITEDKIHNFKRNTYSKKRRSTERKHKKTHKKLKKKDDYEIEEGECSEDIEPSDINSDEDFNCVADNKQTLNFNVTHEDSEKYNVSGNENDLDGKSYFYCNIDFDVLEIGKGWPPCMRIIVKETNVKNLQIGTLFMITYPGGTLGREGDHAILIPDINISKYHAKFNFDNKDKKNETGNYTLTDLGSRNGTFIDGKRLSTALQESKPYPVPHGCNIRVGGTTLLCHIHTGHETCSECEPGLIISDTDEKRNAYVLEEHISKKRKRQLKKLKQKFGLSSSGEGIQTATIEYKDRAEIRRQTIGSHSDSFKTEVASVTAPIKNTNKGFKMLSKMGWVEGESLGTKSEDAIKEPILVQQRAEKVGLGYDKPVEAELDESIKRKQEIWKKVADRYKNLE